MWLGLTIARSRPAWTQWCRKVELSTARAPGETPKETFETPERGLHAGDLLLDRFDPRDRLHRRRPPLLIAGREREREAVEDQQLGVEAVLLAAQVADPLGDLDLALGGLRHPDLVDRQRDQRRAVRERQRHDAVELLASGLEVDGVDDRAAGDLVERGRDHLGLGRVDLDRRGLGQRDLLRDQPHLFVLVLALGQRDAQVEHVRAALHLVLGDLHEPVVVVGQQQLLGLARALRVDALADHRRARLLHERGGGDHRGQMRRTLGGPGGYRRPSGRSPVRPTRSTIARM